MKSFFVTIPHSGEKIPSEVDWLSFLKEPTLMRDVDRFVDQLYVPTLSAKKIPSVIATCHRYVIDLNRLENEYDQTAVVDAPWPQGKYPKGLHWSVTTVGEILMPKPMSQALHQQLVETYYKGFHQQVQELIEKLKSPAVYHLDLHSMPSQGTAMHNDPGEVRADIVVSDFHGKSACREFLQLVQEAYQQQGFKVAYNWPYFGGGITQMYGHPEKGQHTLQVELNRSLYMNETTKQKSSSFAEVQTRLGNALSMIDEQVVQLRKDKVLL